MMSFVKNLISKREKPESAAKIPVPELALYHYSGCPFCRAVRKQIERLNLDIEERNIHSQDAFREELIKHGGKKTVPCMRIEKADGEIEWMYESMDIIHYLQKRFA